MHLQVVLQEHRAQVRVRRVRPRRAAPQRQQRFDVAGAPARALKLPAGHPCARVQRLTYDLAGRCVEWRTTLGDANAFAYTVAIT